MRDITIDEHGGSPIVAVNGDDTYNVGSYGEYLAVGDTVDLDDGTTHVVQHIYGCIHTRQGQSNYIYVDLAAE